MASMVMHLQARPFPYETLDEHGHYAYAHHLHETGRWWPDFDHFPLLDAQDQPTAQPNYINHTPVFYWAASGFSSPAMYRWFALLSCGVAWLMYMRLGFDTQQRSLPLAVYTFFPYLLSADWLFGYYSNDSWALLGGCMVCWGTYGLLARPALPRAPLVWLAAGLVFTSVKLTAFLLIGIYAACLLLLHAPLRRRVGKTNILWLTLLCTVLALPYVYYSILYGSPAPTTPGQEFMLRFQPWMDAPRTAFWDWLTTGIWQFVLTPGGAGEHDLARLGLLYLGLSWMALLCMRTNPQQAPVLAMCKAAMGATCIMLCVHVYFTYQRYLAYGWMKDLYLRYYLPLLPVYALSVVSAYQSVIARLQSKRNAQRASA